MTGDRSTEGIRATALLELAERYLQHGLRAAALAVWARLADAEERGVAHARLSELAAAQEEHQLAIAHAERAVATSATVGHRLALAEALLGARQLERAEGQFEAARQAPAAASHERALAAIGLAAVAVERGAAAEAERLLVLAASASPGLEACEAIVELAVACGRQAALRRALSAEGAEGAQLLLEALLLEAISGAEAADEVERLLARAAEQTPAARLALALRLARRRGRDPAARAEAVAQLKQLLALAQETAGDGDRSLSPARLHLLLASIYDDEPQSAAMAATAYAAALEQLPRDAAACNNLGVIALREGDLSAARVWLLRALANDPAHEGAYLNLARLLYAAGTPLQMREVLEELLERGVGANVVANLCFALVEVAREDAQQGLANKGHQLKNLLGVMGTRLRGLARRSEGDVSAALLRICERLSAVYDEWAAYLRTMREEMEAVDSVAINELVAEAAREAGGRVRLRLAERLPEVIGVRRQLLEALVNVMRNGVEAQPADGPPLRVETGPARGGRAVRISVADRGPGIAPTDRRRVLAPGYTTKREGSGLGLSITDRVVRGHGGRMEIDSTPGAGTRVHVLLPVRLESQVQRGMLGAVARVLRSAAAEEYVVEE